MACVYLVHPRRLFRKFWENIFMTMENIGKSEFIKENIDEIIFMFALFKCRKFDKRRN